MPPFDDGSPIRSMLECMQSLHVMIGLQVEKQNRSQGSTANRDASPVEPGKRLVSHAASALGVVARAIEINFAIASDGFDSTRGRQVYS